MRTRIKCEYRNVCNNCSHTSCRSCALRFAPYDKKIAMQIKKDSRKSKFKYEDECKTDLANDVLEQKRSKE